MMGQGASQPVRSEPPYFVTPDGEGAHLWVREGTNLRVVTHGECTECSNPIGWYPRLLLIRKDLAEPNPLCPSCGYPLRGTDPVPPGQATKIIIL